ncbi:DUF975 family protein [Dehalobacter sp. TeCB1]|uniref:DUF975 family protein n=1 Tax=Dehalobacter sp. TeCB1 TaxID=1843715 RepID=UPI00083B2F20|nr:DUF975 family protein [Dehalobacter sp. TeCB1]OCZ53511.1 hypothetical protein A7D23_08165 [Dehalobacter sp. TeCB1]
MLENKELRAMARTQLNGNWLKPILACLIYAAIVFILSWIPCVGPIITILIAGPLMIGLVTFTLKFCRAEDPNVEVVLSGFKNAINCAGLYLWYMLWTLLWSLLLIIPGIVKAYGYMMSFYIYADNPDMGIKKAFDLSKKISYGYRGKLFLLTLSFIGWAILATIPFCLGYIWLMPYMQITFTNFYQELKKESIKNGVCTAEEF